MSTEPGIVGSNVGPTPGATPSADADLHQGANPYGNGLGSPSHDLAHPLGYGSSPSGDNPTAADLAQQTPWTVAGPYYASPPPAGGNPWSQGAPTKSEAGDRAASADVSGALDNLYSHTLGQYERAGMDRSEGPIGEADGPIKPLTADPKYIGNENYDEGFGRSGEGRS